MTAPVGVVMRRAAELAASRLGGESVSREARRPTSAVHSLRPRTCTYCPGRALHGKPTCHAHSDLIALDPFFTPDVKQEPAERSLDEALLDGLQTAGG